MFLLSIFKHSFSCPIPFELNKRLMRHASMAENKRNFFNGWVDRSWQFSFIINNQGSIVSFSLRDASLLWLSLLTGSGQQSSQQPHNTVHPYTNGRFTAQFSFFWGHIERYFRYLQQKKHSKFIWLIMVLLIVFLHSWKFQTFSKNTTIPQTTQGHFQYHSI